MGKELLRFILMNIGDLFIIGGFTLMVIAFFLFVSKFAGYIALSIVFVILGIVLSKIGVDNKK